MQVVYSKGVVYSASRVNNAGIVQMYNLQCIVGPDWLIRSTGRIPGGPVCFFGREGRCCHGNGLKYGCCP